MAIRQKRTTTPIGSPSLVMIEDIIETNELIKRKIKDAHGFYDLMTFTPDDFLQGSEITESNDLIISPKISQLYYQIQSAIQYSSPTSRALFNTHLLKYTAALAYKKGLNNLQETIIPLFKRCFKESIDKICQKFIFASN